MRLWYLQEREGVNLADLTIEEMDAQYLQEVKEQSYISYANALVGFAMYSYQLQMRIEGASKTDGAGSDIKFGSDTKSAQKLSNQMNKRGWTEEMVEDTVRNPYTTRVSTNKATGNSATVYYNKSGSYVVIDDVTKEVVQISDNINPSTWIPDPSIIDPYKP